MFPGSVMSGPPQPMNPYSALHGAQFLELNSRETLMDAYALRIMKRSQAFDYNKRLMKRRLYNI